MMGRGQAHRVQEGTEMDSTGFLQMGMNLNLACTRNRSSVSVTEARRQVTSVGLDGQGPDDPPYEESHHIQ